MTPVMTWIPTVMTRPARVVTTDGRDDPGPLRSVVDMFSTTVSTTPTRPRRPERTPRHRGEVRLGPETTGAAPARRLPSAARVLLAVVMMFAAVSSAGLVTMLPGLAEAALSWPVAGQAALQIGACAVATVAAVGLVALAMRFVDRRPLIHTGWGWTRRSLPALLLGVVTAIGTTLLAAVPVSSAGLVRPLAPEDYTGGNPLWVVIPVALATSFLLQAIPEELIWRGYVLQTLRISPVTAVYVSATVFAALHVVSRGGQQNVWERLVYLALPFGFALLAGALVLRTGSLWSAVGVHGGVHVAVMIGTLWLAIGTGPALWVTIGLVQTLIGIVLLHRGRGTRTPKHTTQTREQGA